MKQLLQNMRNGKPNVVEVPVPQVRSGMILIKTAASLVSAGTERMLVEFAEKNLVAKAASRPDLVRQLLDKARREGLLTTIEAAFNRLDQPMPLGYSSAGTVLAVGNGVTGFKPGDRVACAGGNYAVHAEYAVVPKNLVTLLPPEVDFESAAFTTLGAIALQGFRLADLKVGERVAIIGMGLLGLLSTGIARAAGCQVFGVDISPDRIALGQKMGAAAVLRDQAESTAQTFTRGLGFDAVLICADSKSNDTVELAGKICRDRGKVVAVGAVGMNIPRKIYYEKELDFLISRSYGPGRYDSNYEEKGNDYPIGFVRWTEGRNFQAIIDLLASQKMDIRPLISHRFPIELAEQAYDLITGKTKQPFLGVLITYPNAEEKQPSSRVEIVTAAASPQHTLKLGVLGAGNYATAVFLPAIKAVGGCERIGIATASGVSAQNAAKKFGFQFASSSEKDIFDNPDINVVTILTRHQHHTRQILTAFEKGKHVFCEKPLALNSEELDHLAEAIQKPGAPLLMAGFNRRFAPLAQKLKKFIDQRSEPAVIHYQVNAGYIPSNHWIHDPLQGGGRIIGEGCHFIDFLTYLVGQPPIHVSALSLPDNGKYNQDNVTLNFHFPDGSIGSINYLANGDKSFPKERVELFTSGQVAVLNDYRSLELVKNGQRQSEKSWLSQDKGHRAGWAAFLQALNNGGTAPIPYDHLIGVTRASFQAVRAITSGEQDI
jgi:predicted dehydrogenase/threonine dehydrogenase-like Zn-dependent dehydrogenase